MVDRLQNIGIDRNRYFSQMAGDYKAEVKPENKWEVGEQKTFNGVAEAMQKLMDKGNRAPYSLMADENGIVKYKGVEFRCDYENNRLCLGDVSNPKNCITVSLEKGGCLVFNRNNTDDLVRAIGMFSPEDVNRIMRAIAEDAKIRQVKLQIEDEASGMEVLDKPEDKEGGAMEQAVAERRGLAGQTEENGKYESERQTEQPGF